MNDGDLLQARFPREAQSTRLHQYHLRPIHPFLTRNHDLPAFTPNVFPIDQGTRSFHLHRALQLYHLRSGIEPRPLRL